ncbi:hypothetical protein Sulku_1970 [Sulfuricurvum kujiense DSM 16994]|uniref:Uncharacterized protein n=1 Tax=Sulfuricurvum kujiense (strain ATCC BAA-921 / DSM 16994 / JCM 11577 / YK-1) TaxID=709032 RepID=E4U273_SULKY|nr:hypothetical protein [Sulfuricurvum kujiense]ADR34630.1 hypothetical protein Sulku_1970 [Sulfuricurvum kujiense DSM 16994]
MKKRALFAVNMLIYDYFNGFDVFQKMTIIPVLIEANRDDSTERYGIEAQRLFLSDTSANASANYFLVDAEDEANRLLKVIQENLQYIKILPKYDGEWLIEELSKRIEIYRKNAQLS